jgi:hypothetical protein
MADHPPKAKSNERISPEDVKKMDAEVPHTDHVEPGISIRMGPVDAEDKMDVDAPETNGNTNGKRKSYKDVSSSEEDDKPLVRISQGPLRALCHTNEFIRVSGGEHHSKPKQSRTIPTQSSAMCL